MVAGPFMLVIVAMCVSLMKSLRAEPYEVTLPTRVRRAVLHAQKYDLVEHQTVARPPSARTRPPTTLRPGPPTQG